ncbi:ECF transporter S component [Cellulomonas sp. PhB143]|uniref:ECF transporter S component n=1 Tax=Cellulomonas sp. PhB143 TaxID=2485186 RepID=UPI000F4745B1|nr:ECF transporter S component [Cellulomonas sp. PhB143]ROS74566.1 energy-coupling factor transport system substrate-specific component [Cellulomonas sp. PhB143]
MARRSPASTNGAPPTDDPAHVPAPALVARRASGLHTTVLLAVLAVTFGFVFWVADQVYAPLSLALGPFATLGENVLAGAWIVVAPLALHIVRRPLAGIGAELLAAAVELVVFGSPFGPAVLLSGLVQGVGAELPFALTRYRRYGWGVFVASGVSAAVVTFAYQCVTYGYLGQDLVVVRLAVQVVSCVLLSGVAARLLGDGLLRAGVLDNHAIGRAARLRADRARSGR